MNELKLNKQATENLGLLHLGEQNIVSDEDVVLLSGTARSPITKLPQFHSQGPEKIFTEDPLILGLIKASRDGSNCMLLASGSYSRALLLGSLDHSLQIVKKERRFQANATTGRSIDLPSYHFLKYLFDEFNQRLATADLKWEFKLNGVKQELVRVRIAEVYAVSDDEIFLEYVPMTNGVFLEVDSLLEDVHFSDHFINILKNIVDSQKQKKILPENFYLDLFIQIGEHINLSFSNMGIVRTYENQYEIVIFDPFTVLAKK